jgi:four helix bundle protein
MAKKVEELEVWQRAKDLGVAVNATINGVNFQKDWKLRDQIRDATDSVLSNISEGFEQPTDRAFAHYLYVSKASNAETRVRLGVACRRSYISQVEFENCDRIGDQIARMLTGLIKYLVSSDRTDRGIGRRRNPAS